VPTATASDVIDTGEIYAEEIPSELLERVAEHHAQLYEVSLQVKRSGKWSTMRQGKLAWTKQPPSSPVNDICVHLVKLAFADAEQHGEGQRYRARLRCRNNGGEYSRYASVVGVLTDDGAITIVDAPDKDNDPLALLIEAKRQSDEISFRALAAMADTTVRFGSIADAFTRMMVAAGGAYAHSVGGQADLLRVQVELESNKYQHEQKMAKLDKGFGLLERPVQRIGDEIVDTIIASMKSKRAEAARGRPAAGRTAGSRARQSGPGTRARTTGPTVEPADEPADEPETCEYAQTLDGVFAGLSESDLKAAQAHNTADEWACLNEARRSPTTAAFDATFQRFYVELRKRDAGGSDGTGAWVQRMREIVGDMGVVTLGRLIQRLEESRKAAAQA
jgi:hypothetical protein